MTNKHLTQLAARAFFAVAAAALPAQHDGDKPPKGEQEPAKVAEWPDLKDTAKDRVRALATQFRKPQESVQKQAHKDLVKIGAGAAPVLIPLVTDRADNVNAQIFAVLDEITDQTHTALLVRENERHSVEWRRYLTRRLSRFADPLVVPVLEKAAKDKDETIAFYGALGLVAQKKQEGIDAVLVAARERWAEVGEDIAATLPAARGPEVSMWVFEKIGQAKPVEQMAGLRMLRYLMIKDQKVMLGAYLDSADFTVKREAVNCARVLHGEAPLEKLSSFQVIEMAKQWKAKL
ncbi:MAG: hypothetical protein H6835_19915 [Planctomycetes bacterium]|nr:hypothetical protein [Planctomycetota bacterium]